MQVVANHIIPGISLQFAQLKNGMCVCDVACYSLPHVKLLYLTACTVLQPADDARLTVCYDITSLVCKVPQTFSSAL